jgi:hypothetical protein
MLSKDHRFCVFTVEVFAVQYAHAAFPLLLIAMHSHLCCCALDALLQAGVL